MDLIRARLECEAENPSGIAWQNAYHHDVDWLVQRLEFTQQALRDALERFDMASEAEASARSGEAAELYGETYEILRSHVDALDSSPTSDAA